MTSYHRNLFVFSLILLSAMSLIAVGQIAGIEAGHGGIDFTVTTTDGDERVRVITYADGYIQVERRQLADDEIAKVADDVTMQAYVDNATPTAAENAVAIKLMIEHGGWRMGP